MKLFFLSLLLLISLSSCVTQALWSAKTYEENIKQLFVGSDEQHVVLTGEQYHYILKDNSDRLKTILSLGKSGVFEIDQDNSLFRLKLNQNVEYTLSMIAKVSAFSDEEIQILKSGGIWPDTSGTVAFRVTLTGKRYDTKYLGHEFAAVGQFNHKITVRYHDSNFVKNVGKIVVTPIAVGLDVIVLIGKVVISPLKLVY